MEPAELPRVLDFVRAKAYETRELSLRIAEIIGNSPPLATSTSGEKSQNQSLIMRSEDIRECVSRTHDILTEVLQLLTTL